MPRWRGLASMADPTMLAALAGLMTVGAACYGGVLFGGRQFAFRDSGHFYYPLYWRVQQEWSAGRLPLWEPGANGGTPILGSPMAAVLYPGKLLFAIVPYAWGIRIYTVGHELLAFGAMMALMRSWGVGRAGAALAGLSYAFGGPVLSDYFNIIYLVGAAWMPLGFRAADRWLRLHRPGGLVELSLILAMQILGGDPEAAYLTGVCALGYAVGLARSEVGLPSRPWSWFMGLAGVAVAWMGAGPWIAGALHGGGGAGQALLASAWLVGLVVYAASRRRGVRSRPVAMLLGLAAAGALALLLSAVQVLPVLENIAASVRWAGSGSEFLYDSSLLPYRVVEAIWPNVFGTFTAGNRYWMPILPPAGAQRPSPLSLYCGALTVLLAVGGAGFRKGPPWRAWMTAVMILGFWASLGAFAGPESWTTENLRGTVGDDSFYGLLTSVLPGLRLFRLPFKLLIVTSMAASALAGLGWDRFAAGEGRRRVVAVGIGLLLSTLLCLLAAAMMRGRLISALAARDPGHAIFGPLDAAGAVGFILRGLAQGAVALGSGLAVLAWMARRPGSIGTAAMAILLLAADLAIADAPLIVDIPQADFDRESAVARVIREAERRDPSPGPFRIHRLPSWLPVGWGESSSSDRLRELIDWEIDTLQPSFGWLHGMSYVFVDESETGRSDFRRLFRPSFRTADPGLSAALGVEPGRRVLHHPRAIYDLWGARYFVLPSYPEGWVHANRSYFAFLDQADPIYPDPASLDGPEHARDRVDWMTNRDVQVRRNRRAFPRAWVVHDARFIRSLAAASPSQRDALIARLAEPTDDPASPAPDLRTIVYLESVERAAVAPFLSPDGSAGTGPTPASGESVAVTEDAPTRVTIEADLGRPGIVVLADTIDPGWRLTIDGRPAPILRANLLMRGAAVGRGRHTLVYQYDPASVRIGAAASLAGVLLLVGLGLGTSIRRRSPTPRTITEPIDPGAGPAERPRRSERSRPGAPPAL